MVNSTTNTLKVLTMLLPVFPGALVTTCTKPRTRGGKIEVGFFETN
jgi:hypothetical protein